MTDKNPTTVISQAIDMIGDDLQGHPLHIERPGKEDFVLVSADTYSGLIARIYELEQAAMTADHEQELLRLLVESADSSG